jgi:FHA domain/Integrin beta chain VWA domain
MKMPVKSFRSAAARAACCLAMLVWSLAMVAKAQASLKISLGNPGLEHFDSDGGVQLDFGVTDANGQPVGNLSPDNIKIFEDGKPAKLLDFRGVGQGRPVDIVFVMDVTESMQPYIDAIKQSMISFAHDLAANNRDYRLGLVTFEDYVISKYADCNCAYRNKMTSNVNEFVSWVGSLHASGGGDIPEDQLDALAYAASFPFRPNAEAILILVTDAPCHVAGDGPDREGDAAYREHRASPNADVTNLTGSKVAAMLKKNGLTLYAVAPPPFIAPQYQEIVEATHGRSYNIITEEGRFASLVREIGHSIATEYSLTYLTPRPIEDGTNRAVKLEVSYDGMTGTATTSYQVRGLGGAAINVPAGGGLPGGNQGGTGLRQLSFSWYHGAVPLLAILGLFGLSRMRFGVSAEELKAILEAQAHPAPNAGPGAAARAAARASEPVRAAAPSGPYAGPAAAGARLTTVNPAGPVAAEYAVLKDEVSLGRGEDNDIVIPHASVSRTHARLLRRAATYELMDLKSTNGTYVDDRAVQGSATVQNGSRVRLGDVQFILRF